MTALSILRGGPLSLLQDRGRFGRADLGLSTGGPMDPVAAGLANALLENDGGATLIEASFGGLELRAEASLQLAVTGAELPLELNGEPCALWSVLELAAGDLLRLHHPSRGCRNYLAVRGGFAVTPSFGSTATVLREGIGGISGKALQAGDRLEVRPAAPIGRRWLPPDQRPAYPRRLTLRVVLGYQHRAFSDDARETLFSSAYAVSQRSDRMGYRLEGPPVSCEIDGVLSEGIAPGAIQIPADGQPIVLLRDRQTIGGYPKIGSALSQDCSQLTQLRPGDTVNFAPIPLQAARRALHLSRVVEEARRFEALGS
ncbi:MAG: biotin-dependent carboxyltransferase family protein [Pseudomonadota bacterium]